MKPDPCKPQACRIQKCLKVYSSPMASLVLTDSSQLTALKSYQTKLCIPTPNHMFLTEEWTLYERLAVECNSTLNCLGRVRNLQLLMQYV
uniref:Uncharacterized protein n=1 Tax=Timema tahoe TaxID=61484 RepID=A0A7R9IF94_9NEOP|nr:unnamed protein product [Timema tahoe]